MTGYRFARSAEEDLADIVDYTIRAWGSKQAIAYIDGLEHVATSLASNPRIGKTCNELGAGLRAFPYQSHTLYYLTDADFITIIRVLHQSMNPELRFNEE